MIKSAIFVLYHKASTRFESDIYHPLQTGVANAGFDLGMLRDDTGDNISRKNQHYGELSGWYWVWKNWLPDHPEVDRIGFCHYRRFLNPFRRPSAKFPFRPVPARQFEKQFFSWKDEEVDAVFHSADIVLPHPRDLRKSPLYDKRHETVYTQYSKAHPQPDMDEFLEIVSSDSPTSAFATKQVLSGHILRDCLMFVMRRDLFDDLANWTFQHLFRLESRSHWERYTHYMDIRTPAYLMERFFNVWLALHPEASVLERDSVRFADETDRFLHRIRLSIHRLRHPPHDARTVSVPAGLRT